MGTRLWPWSRQSFPKQFLNLIDDESLLQATVNRLAGFPIDVKTVALGNEEHRFLVAEQLGPLKIGFQEIVLEPVGRNTAPVAIVAALRTLALYGPDVLVLLTPADHHMADPDGYRVAIERAIPAARDGRVVAFGIPVVRAETGLGYIQVGGELAGTSGIFSIVSFKEKPDAKTAAKFILDDSYLWNAGIFLFQPQTLIDIASAHRSDMVDACRKACENGTADGVFFRLDECAFSAIGAESFDCALMEDIGDNGAVVPMSVGWTDLGSWESVRRGVMAEKDRGNTTRGPVETFACSGTLGLSDGPLVVAHGLEDAVIVANHDAVYVAAAGVSQDLSYIVDELDRKGRAQAATHLKVFRPWGWYQTISTGDGFEVREIVVKPGGQLSLQLHHHRSEHWVVVRGQAHVTVGEKVKFVSENESVYVPQGTKHRLENLGETPMHLIEVQTGSHLAEDDIVRFEDRYGRIVGRQKN